MDIKKLNKEVLGRYSKGPKFNKHLVEIKLSQIPKAGFGLFAKQDIPKGSIIDYYHGDRLNRKQYREREAGHDFYIMEVNRNLYIDSKDCKCLISYTNDARGLTRMHGVRNNCYFETTADERNIAMVTSRKIKAGEELFVYYGNSYWNTVKYFIETKKELTY